MNYVVSGGKLEKSAPIGFLLYSLGDLAIMLPLMMIVCRVFPITVSSAGLRAWNGAGFYSQLPWDSLQQLSALNLLGFKYFRFKRDGMPFAALVPFDLDDPKQFCDEVERYLGEGNPIVANLRSTWNLPPPEVARPIPSN